MVELFTVGGIIAFLYIHKWRCRHYYEPRLIGHPSPAKRPTIAIPQRSTREVNLLLDIFLYRKHSVMNIVVLIIDILCIGQFLKSIIVGISYPATLYGTVSTSLHTSSGMMLRNGIICLGEKAETGERKENSRRCVGLPHSSLVLRRIHTTS